MNFVFLIQVKDYEKELAENRLKISQNEAALESMQESLKESENKKRTLEELIDELKGEVAKVKAAGLYSYILMLGLGIFITR